MATSVSIKGKTQANEAVTSTINYVNPAATNAQLTSLASAMNALTTNTIVDITKIDKNSLLNTIEKQSHNLQLSPATVAAADISTDLTQPTTVTLTGAEINQEELRIGKSGNDDYVYVDFYSAPNVTTRAEIYLVRTTDTIGANGEIVIEIPETSNYQAASVTLAVTAG